MKSVAPNSAGLPTPATASTEGEVMAETPGNWHGYDIIGDIHGCANTLEKLLQKMNYECIEGAYRHPCRQAVFLGDVVDRGPHIREALHLVKNMVDCGSAVCVLG